MDLKFLEAVEERRVLISELTSNYTKFLLFCICCAHHLLNVPHSTNLLSEGLLRTLDCCFHSTSIFWVHIYVIYSAGKHKHEWDKVPFSKEHFQSVGVSLRVGDVWHKSIFLPSIRFHLANEDKTGKRQDLWFFSG